ncbi:hypothetical protein BHM03_00052417 [Ensete ventricosum]|nr:hypothetical protein BHM03_00052417 [Ensete ventricosum]
MASWPSTSIVDESSPMQGRPYTTRPLVGAIDYGQGHLQGWPLVARPFAGVANRKGQPLTGAAGHDQGYHL